MKTYDSDNYLLFDLKLEVNIRNLEFLPKESFSVFK